MSEDDIRLSPTSYVVLGLIHLRGPSTPYELEAAVQKSVEYFWKFPHSQLYREPDRLAASGHLTVDQEPGGRRRKVFTLTSQGRSALTSWLERPVQDVFEMRDEAVLQLFFSDQLTASALVDLARREIALYQQRLDEYERIAARELPRHGQDRRMAPLRLGAKLAEAFREFWEEIAQDPPPPTRDPVDGPPGRLC
ncbi:PadR family transcriptional regulator [Pseudonocardia sp.]|uniref:PadR family transcriptional regulator n=1 Tax=Pseudonocardia sp. TaxID=60912 RepID=UPI002603E331|nr:PadR family transcriptional regulator [Pseudonocardia sp.]